MFIAAVTYNWEDMPGGIRAYTETFSEALQKLEIMVRDLSPNGAKAIEIFEAEGKFAPGKLIASMRTIK
jgi:hypothetical protein